MTKSGKFVWMKRKFVPTGITDVAARRALLLAPMKFSNPVSRDIRRRAAIEQVETAIRSKQLNTSLGYERLRMDLRSDISKQDQNVESKSELSLDEIVDSVHKREAIMNSIRLLIEHYDINITQYHGMPELL